VSVGYSAVNHNLGTSCPFLFRIHADRDRWDRGQTLVGLRQSVCGSLTLLRSLAMIWKLLQQLVGRMKANKSENTSECEITLLLTKATGGDATAQDRLAALLYP